MEREYLYDNIKAFLIFCVVLGHMLEGILDGSIKVIYILIYTFHMPMFVFISGIFAKFKTERIKKLFALYLAFQGINCLIGIAGGGNIQFTTPIWSLWYLLALSIWTMLIPFIDVKEGNRKFIVIVAAFAVSLIAGYDTSIGYYMSISRIIVFFPYFVLGFYYARSKEMQKKVENLKSEYMVLFMLAVSSIICFLSEEINPKWLYGSYTYDELRYNFLYRIFFYICGIVFCVSFLKLFPKRKTIFSYIGQHTMQIFLLHSFIIEILRKKERSWQYLSENKVISIAVLISAIIIYVLSVDVNTIKCLYKNRVKGKK